MVICALTSVVLVCVRVVGMVSLVAMVVITSSTLLGLLDIHVKIREQVLPEIVVCHLTTGHELVRHPPDVPNDQGHRAPGRNP